MVFISDVLLSGSQGAYQGLIRSYIDFSIFKALKVLNLDIFFDKRS